MRATSFCAVILLAIVPAGIGFGSASERPEPDVTPEALAEAVSSVPAAVATAAAPELSEPAVAIEASSESDADAAVPAPPFRVGLQAGHWKAAEAPDELAGIRDNGTRGGGKAEWEVNLAIAELAAAELGTLGYLVDILPATVPPRYRADLFISIHADGNNDPNVTGYRVGSPRRDRTGRAEDFAEVLAQIYGEATGVRRHPTVTRRMRGYYAFNYRRYDHAVHPETVSVILETGFLTSPVDRTVIVDAPDRAARGIVDAVIRFLGEPVPDALEGGAIAATE